MRKSGVSLLFVCCLVGWMSCTKRTTVHEGQTYTQIDSLTDTYLNLQDSLLITWNMMVKDENEKLKSMHELLQNMNSSNLFDKASVLVLVERLEQVEKIRFNQKTMANPHVVEEYDFASNSLISEIVSLAESNQMFVQKKGMLSLIDYINQADQRVIYYRSDYDYVAQQFNAFLEKNAAQLKEIDENGSHEKRPLFQMASDN